MQAQAIAAEAFGAERTWFLANGSTCGIEAAILATCGPDDKLILPRNVHSSAISGLILSGARPIYVSPTYSHDWDMPLGVEPAEIEKALDEHPEAKAILVVSPTYHGISSDLEAIAQLTHTRNLPLIVDEAHAPHFAFHPEFPLSALAAGADIAIQSAHKVLSAFTQSALLHVQGDRIDPHRISQCLQLTQSTSPSYLLLGSLDAARHQMATEGFACMERTLKLADRAEQALNKLPGLRVLQLEGRGQRGGDRTRLTIDVSGIGLTGFEADEILHQRLQVTAELPALQHIMFIISLGNTPADITHLINGFTQLCQQYPPIESANTAASNGEHTAVTLPPDPSSLPISTPPLSPRQAFFSTKTARPIAQAIGHICAETICPYPPGIPALLPGEPISTDAIAYLQRILSAGGLLTGCQDTTLQTILTVKY